MKKVAKLWSQDADLTQAVEPVVDRLNEMVDVPMLQGRLLENVDITENQTNRIRHGLGQKLRGWIVVRQTIEQVFFSDAQDSNGREDEELWLIPTTASGSAKSEISLWVF
jgi:hypothetical protein